MIWTDKATTPYYQMRTNPFPLGAIVLKAEYSDDDGVSCTQLAGFTAMRREAEFDPAGGDWHWQKADAAGNVFQDGKVARCSGCHASCQKPPDSFDWTCSAVKAN